MCYIAQPYSTVWEINIQLGQVCCGKTSWKAGKTKEKRIQTIKILTLAHYIEFWTIPHPHHPHNAIFQPNCQRNYCCKVWVVNDDLIYIMFHSWHSMKIVLIICKHLNIASCSKFTVRDSLGLRFSSKLIMSVWYMVYGDITIFSSNYVPVQNIIDFVHNGRIMLYSYRKLFRNAQFLDIREKFQVN